ncbi:MAG: AraC family transcriptional regulator ligand-binding domain-containing protein [Pseudomonadota bacterium]
MPRLGEGGAEVKDIAHQGGMNGAIRQEPRAIATGVMMITAYALSRGISMQELEEGVGPDVVNVFDPGARVSDQVGPRFWQFLDERLPGEPCSLRVAQGAPFTFFGGLAEGAQFAEDFRAALTLLFENRRILADRLDGGIVERGDEVYLLHYHPLDHLDNGRSCEFAFGMGTRLLRDILATEVNPVRVEFAHSANGPIKDYEELFQAPVHFMMERTSLVYRAEDMATEVKHANVELFAFVRAHFRRELQRLGGAGAPEALSDLRQAIIENAARGTFDAEAIAATAGMGLRSAQRLAAHHNTSVSTMIDEIRATSAKELLRDTDSGIDTISMTLGYSDSRAFRRAFKRWTGFTPSAYRQSMKK